MLPRRALILATSLTPPLAPEEISEGLRPRIDYLDLQQRLHADLVDFSIYQHGWPRYFQRVDALSRLAWGEALYAVRNWQDYDTVYSLSEDVGLPLAVLLHLHGIETHHLMVVHNILSPKKVPLVRALGCMSRFQRILVVGVDVIPAVAETYGVDEERLAAMTTTIDDCFWYPSGEAVVDDKLVLSVGKAKRDYETLLRATETLPLRLHIQAHSQWPIRYNNATDEAPTNLTWGSRISFLELRNLYERAAFVVIPLLPGAHPSAGTTTIMEAMAMGKAVIISTVSDVSQYVRQGETGFIVPPGRPEALREAIRLLLGDPDRARVMGEQARALYASHPTFDDQITDMIRLSSLPALSPIPA